MAVAYFMSHLPRSFFPVANGGDAAVLYCFVFFYIFFAGGGPWRSDGTQAGLANLITGVDLHRDHGPG
jgi:putative oxidoreductase